MSDQDQNKPLSYGSLIPKLELDDVDSKPVVLTIAGVRRQNMAPGGRGEEIKIVLTFQEKFPVPATHSGDERDGSKREYIVNATSYKTLCEKLGSDERRWVGREVAMAPTTNSFNGRAFEKIHVATPERWEKLMSENKAAVGSPAPAKARR